MMFEPDTDEVITLPPEVIPVVQISDAVRRLAEQLEMSTNRDAKRLLVAMGEAMVALVQPTPVIAHEGNVTPFERRH
jgi:hypothetical protein